MDLSSVADMCALESVLCYHHCHGYLIIIIVYVLLYYYCRCLTKIP